MNPLYECRGGPAFLTFKKSILSLTIIVMVITGWSYGQKIMKRVPDKIDIKADYLFYLHGRIVEIKGIRPFSEKYGFYEYEKILSAFKDEGFSVISEVRKNRTPIGVYAQKVASQIRKLLQAGVPPCNIIVIGASKGALITMQISTILQNKEVNYVILAGCQEQIFHRFDIDLNGRILSIYDEKDELVGPCQKFFEKSTGIKKYKEIKLNIGSGHGICYQPLKEWITPILEWVKNGKNSKLN